jgi:hypothetical protein
MSQQPPFDPDSPVDPSVPPVMAVGVEKPRSKTVFYVVIAAGGFFVFLFCLSIPVLLLLPAINAAREAARRNGCINNARQLSIGSLNYESATQEWPQVRTVPGRIDQIAPGSLGDDVSTSSGHSFITKLLPYMEEKILYLEIREDSEKFTLPPFSPEVMGSQGFPGFPEIPSLRCPTFSGADNVDVTGTEYATLSNSTFGLTNYMALVGTHIGSDGKVVENGVMASRCSIDDACDFKGVSSDQIGDGTSKTIILCETREQRYAAWADSQTTWLVGIDASAGLTGVGTPNVRASSHFINVGGKASYQMPGQGWAGQTSRDWGPSSQHAGDVVTHVFADAHTKAISPAIDPTLYYKLITRSGGEAVTQP